MTDNLPRLVLYSKFQGATLRRSTPLILVLLTGGRERNQQCTRQEYFSVFDRAAPIVNVLGPVFALIDQVAVDIGERLKRV